MKTPNVGGLRAALELTQEQMAAQVGVRSNTLARWERGEAPVDGPVLRLFAILEAVHDSGPGRLKKRILRLMEDYAQ